ncbi:MAG: T9SS type A sorting domain-containing protein [Bacteroidota bacterium]
MKKTLSLLFLAILTAGLLHAQKIQLAPSVLSAGGGYFEGNDISISWTLGELAVSTLTGTDLVLTQGFQQPFDLDVGMKKNQVNWGISAYPNPVGDELRIRFNIEATGDFFIEIQDVTGRLISQEKHKQVNPGDIILLNTSGYTNGVYFLKVLTPDRRQVQVTSLRKL